jgi:hypothetical protein
MAQEMPKFHPHSQNAMEWKRFMQAAIMANGDNRQTPEAMAKECAEIADCALAEFNKRLDMERI